MEQKIERQLQTDKKFAELGRARADFVKTHFVNDGFYFEHTLSEQGDALFPIIESSRAGDELANSTRILASHSPVPGH